MQVMIGVVRCMWEDGEVTGDLEERGKGVKK